MHSNKTLKEIAKLLRYYIILSTTKAGSGHPTSSLSSVELMTVLFFGDNFKADLENFDELNNDRIVFSKGHAAPLLYSLYTALGKITEKELLTLREFGSRLEGHPTMNFPFTELATGSLGQGIGNASGIALKAKTVGSKAKTFVLLGDGEMAEGSVWESLEIAAKYNLDNLVGIIDVNSLGQSGKTLDGHNLSILENKVDAFGWESVVIDGHNLEAIREAFSLAKKSNKPFMIIAKTIKGKGVSLVEGKNGHHGKILSRDELLQVSHELGAVNKSLKLTLKIRECFNNMKPENVKIDLDYQPTDVISTRQAFGQSLLAAGKQSSDIYVFDAETNNSTYTKYFKEELSERFFEMYIAEQNMVSMASGFSKRGGTVFVSTFAAFLTRAYDQIRMAQYSDVKINIVGSHAGVSIGEDGSSQMALEDIAMMRSVEGSRVFYPCDAVSTSKIVELMVNNPGINYLRNTRAKTAVMYDSQDKFNIGGSKVLQKSENDSVVLVGAGITVHECLKAWKILKEKGVNVSVVDLYSVKPFDKSTLLHLSKNNKKILVVEDHHRQGGVFSAIAEEFVSIPRVKVYSLAVTKIPRSGKPEELLRDQKIDANSIVSKVLDLVI